MPAPLTLTRALVLNAVMAGAYFAAAAVGFRLAVVAERVTSVWAPMGVALATLLLGGLRLSLAIWVGALVANLGTGAPAESAIRGATKVVLARNYRD